MKTKFISMALFAILSTMSVSCQKETLVEPQVFDSEVGTLRTIHYTIDGVKRSITITGDSAMKTFVDHMVELANHGYTINIVDPNARTNGIESKEVLTYTTKNKDDASTWSAKKINEGFEVTIVQNPKTGEYTCIATR